VAENLDRVGIWWYHEPTLPAAPDLKINTNCVGVNVKRISSRGGGEHCENGDGSTANDATSQNKSDSRFYCICKDCMNRAFRTYTVCHENSGSR